jgi:diguanylate cyclase (GGDEF)-like protein
MSGASYQPKPSTLLARLRAVAADRTKTPARLMLAGTIGVFVLAVFFMSGTFAAIGYIDSTSVASETARATIALERVMADKGALPDAASAARLQQDFQLRGARIAAPETVAAGESAIAIPGTTTVLAWMPRRFGSEAFEAVAPIRLTLAALTIAWIGFIFLKLNHLARDLEARRVLAQELASRDALTGLKNRLTFDHEMRTAFSQGVTRERPLALLYLDLDAFKSVNDTLGHMAGDELLRLAGERLTAAVEPGDSVARLGGDEFAVLHRGTVDRPDLVALAVRIRAALSTPFLLDGTLATIGVSIGIAIAPEMAGTAEALVRAADVALYRAKAGGETHYAFATTARMAERFNARAAA